MSAGILLIEDHAITRESLKTLIESYIGYKIIGEAETGLQAVELAEELKPDIILMDLSLPEMDGVEATKRILEDNPKAKIITLTMYANQNKCAMMFRAGALGYILKTCTGEQLRQALDYAKNARHYLDPQLAGKLINHFAAFSGNAVPGSLPPLTPRQTEVVQMLTNGKKTVEIAKELGISPKTVETHRRQIMDKLNVRGMAGLTKYAFREGLTDIETSCRSGHPAQ